MIASSMYIDGMLVDTENKVRITCPGDLTHVGEISVASTAEADLALISAEKAKNTWSTLSTDERVEWMFKLRTAICENENELRNAVRSETGKTWEGTGEDFNSLVNSLAFYGEEIKNHTPKQVDDRDGTHSHEIVYQPAGVVVAYLAWNFPLLNMAFKIGPAMAAGCPIIIKPSLKSPLSAYLIGKLCYDIGLPRGAVNIITGDDAHIGDHLSSSIVPSVLTLIGSTQTGKQIMKAGSTSIKKYSMELGGNAPFIVYPDADLDLASTILTALKYGNSGQICVTPNRVYVHDSVYAEFKDMVIEKSKAVVMGYDDTSTMGPLISQGAVDRVSALVSDAKSKGANVLLGGQLCKDIPGYYYPPTVLEDLSSEMKIVHEEVFGPVICLNRFDDSSNISAIANDTDAGLTAYIWSNTISIIDSLSRSLEFGEIQVNGVKYDIYLPHIGIKQSGVGCDCSIYALDDYLVMKRITKALG